MKKIFLLIAAVVTTLSFAAAQEYKVEGYSIVFTKVIEDTGKSIAETHDALESFFALRYNDVNSTEKLNQPDHLIYKGLFMNVHTYSMGMWVNDIPHTVDVAIKDNRVRIKVTIEEGVCRGTQSPNRYTYLIAEAPPIKNDAKNVIKSVAVKTFDATCVRINALFADIENSLRNATTEEDW